MAGNLGTFQPIFGLIVWATVMGLVIKGVRIPLHWRISSPIVRLLVLLRLRDPRPSSFTSTLDSVNTSPSPDPSDATVGQAIKDEEAGRDLRDRLELVLDLRTAPVAGVILLLITQTIDVSVLRLGIKGEDGVRPYDVLVLFISLAYISTALDSTGALRSLAFFISQRAARRPKHSPPSADKMASGPRLFSMLYAFWFSSGIIVGNDPIVLSGTAFLGYFTRVTGITNPTAWTFSQFIAANIASAVLVSSNPTNVLIAAAFKLNFITGFTAFTALPSVITGLIAFPLTYFTFTLLRPPTRDAFHQSKFIPSQLLPPDVAPRSALLDPRGAAFHASLMAVTLALLVGSTFIPHEVVEVWMITAAAGIIGLSFDFASEWIAPIHRPEAIELEEQSPKSPKNPSWPTDCEKFPTTSTTISRLPLNLLPFAGGIFVLSRALTHLGWTSVFATALARVSPTPAAIIFFLGFFVTLVMCPLCGTNIGATILLVEILRDPNYSQAPHIVADPRILKGAIYSTALASNLGAFSWTFSSSLAGLLWISILRQKGIMVKTSEFAKWNLLFLPTLTVVSSSVVLLECYYF